MIHSKLSREKRERRWRVHRGTILASCDLHSTELFIAFLDMCFETVYVANLQSQQAFSDGSCQICSQPSMFRFCDQTVLAACEVIAGVSYCYHGDTSVNFLDASRQPRQPLAISHFRLLSFLEYVNIAARHWFTFTKVSNLAEEMQHCRNRGTGSFESLQLSFSTLPSLYPQQTHTMHDTLSMVTFTIFSTLTRAESFSSRLHNRRSAALPSHSSLTARSPTSVDVIVCILVCRRAWCPELNPNAFLGFKSHDPLSHGKLLAS